MVKHVRWPIRVPFGLFGQHLLRISLQTECESVLRVVSPAVCFKDALDAPHQTGSV